MRKPLVLLQVQTQTTLQLAHVGSVSSTSAVLHMRTYTSNPMNVASVIQCGIQAVLGAIMHFSVEPPRIMEGITQLGTDLLKCVEKMFEPKDLKADGYVHFKEAWEISFQEIGPAAQSIEADLAWYSREGHTPALIRAIGSIIGEAGVICRFLPPDVGMEVRKYLDVVVESFDTMSTSWDEFSKGNTVDGIEAIYWGLRTITSSFIPDVLKDNEVYNTIIGTLDFVLGNLSTHVLEYERRIMESKVCWRTEKRRGEQRPSECEDDYVHDGGAYCYPRRQSLVSVSSSTNSFDRTLMKKNGGGDGGYATGEGAIPARCDPSTDYTEKHGHFCYTPCGSGWQVKPEDFKKCISACEGKFPAETPGMCGADAGIVTKAILEMVTTILNSAFTLAENIIKMKEDGVNAELLSSTIQVFIDMGKPFANPTCPEPETPKAPANHAICSESCMVGNDIGRCRLKSGSLVICLDANEAGACAAGETPCLPTPAPTLALPTPEPTQGWANEGRRRQSFHCMSWCDRHTKQWSHKCKWVDCSACTDCSISPPLDDDDDYVPTTDDGSIAPPLGDDVDYYDVPAHTTTTTTTRAPKCKPYCRKSTVSWSKKCGWSDCSLCRRCSVSSNQQKD
jgi:hypothetical protein